MKLINAIRNAPCKFTTYDKDDNKSVVCSLYYNGKKYYGVSWCHYEDRDFYSEIVGKTIAHYRAILNCINVYLEEAKEAAKIKLSTYKEVNNSMYEVFYNYDELWYNYKSAEKKVKRIRYHKRVIQKELHDYINNHEKAIVAIRYHRKQAETE